MPEVEKLDLESGQIQPEGDAASSSFERPWSLNSRSTTIGSGLSNRSWRPGALLRRLSSHKPMDSWQVAMDKTAPIGRRAFLLFFCRGVQTTPLYQVSALWYTTFLEHKMVTFWTFFRRGLANVKGNEARPSEDDDDMTTAWMFLIAVLKSLSGVRDIALVTIVDGLINDEILKDAETEEDRRALYQLVFVVVGWLSMLYEPRRLTEIKPDKPKRLYLSKYSYRSSGERSPSFSRTVCTRNQDFEAREQPLYNMLGRFGDLVPDPAPSRRSEFAPHSEFITASCLCYHTLRKVCHVDIEWVDTLSMHMEFDSAKKILKIFRSPSFCLLMYRHKKQHGFLDQLFNDKARYLAGGARGLPVESAMTRDLFVELLLTYRLIFSQNAQSWKLFSSEMSGMSKSVLSLPDADPLLPLLCGRPFDSSEVVALYDYIRADDIQAYYTPGSFQFFGGRILQIQGFVETQNPPDWRSLWHDNRNKSNWWAFWAVLFIGGGTIVLMFMSLALQAWQTWLAGEQLKQGRGTK